MQFDRGGARLHLFAQAAVAQQFGDFRQDFQVLLRGRLGHQQENHQAHRLFVGRVETDRVGQLEHGGQRLFEALDAAVRNGHAMPQAGGGIGGQVQVYVTDFGSGMSMIKSDKIRTLAVTTATPSKIFPHLPTVGQTVPGFDLTSWNGIFGPAGLPRPIVDRINSELQVILADKEVQDKLSQLGFEVWPSKTPDEFAKYVSDQLVNWTTLIRQAGIKPE